MPISKLFVAVNLTEIYIVIRGDKMRKKSKMSGENQKATKPILTLFVAINLSEIHIVVSERLIIK